MVLIVLGMSTDNDTSAWISDLIGAANTNRRLGLGIAAQLGCLSAENPGQQSKLAAAFVQSYGGGSPQPQLLQAVFGFITLLGAAAVADPNVYNRLAEIEQVMFADIELQEINTFGDPSTWADTFDLDGLQALIEELTTR